LIKVKKDGLYGLLDKNTFAEKVPCEYEHILDSRWAKKFMSDKDSIELNVGE